MVCLSQVSASERIAQLVCGLPSPLRQERLLLMIQGYFDDSGNEPSSYAFSVAGYLLSASAWGSFADEWVSVLHSNPRIEYFKMYEAVHGSGEFEGIPPEFRKLKTRDLIAVIKTHGALGIASMLTWSHFQEFGKSLPPPLDRQAYAPLFFGLIQNLLNCQKSLGVFPQKTQLDFDDQGSAGAFAIQMYGHLMNGAPPWVFDEEHRAILEGTPRMLNDRDYVPLQAADLLAWVVRTGGTPDGYREGWEWIYGEVSPTLWSGATT